MDNFSLLLIKLCQVKKHVNLDITPTLLNCIKYACIMERRFFFIL